MFFDVNKDYNILVLVMVIRIVRFGLTAVIVVRFCKCGG